MTRTSITLPGTTAAGGKDAARGGAALLRRLGAATLGAALLLGLLAGPALAAERYTKDKVKAAPAPAAEGGTIQGLSSGSPAPGTTDEGSLVARSPKGGASLGAVAIKSPASFNECVRVALAQSPLLTKSAIEIESKRLDVGDAYSQYIPTLTMNTIFYLRLPEYKNPEDEKNRAKYDLNFSTGTWNPLLTMFEVQARKEMVNIAVLAHLKVIDTGIKQLGTTFLQIGMVDNLIKLSKEKEELAAKNLEYVKTRAGLGQGALLEVRIAEGRISIAKAESEKARTTRTVLLDELKFMLGVPSLQKLDLDLADYQTQVLENFNPASVSDETLQKSSFAMRLKHYEQSLQKKSITLAYVHFLPTFSLGFTSVSTLNSTSYKDNQSSIPFMYPNLNFSLPLDWWTKGRDVSRQYKKLSQLNVEAHNLEFQIVSKYQQAQAKLRSTECDLKLAEASAEVQKLQVQQAQLSFESGQAEYDAIVKAMAAYIDSRQLMAQKQHERDTSLLELRSMAGDFQNRYINATIVENQ